MTRNHEFKINKRKDENRKSSGNKKRKDKNKIRNRKMKQKHVTET